MQAFTTTLPLLFLLAACAAEQQQLSTPQTQVPFDASRPDPGTVTSSSNPSLSASTSGKGLSVPHRPDNTDPILLPTRPDALRVRFAVRAVGGSAPDVLRVAQQTSTAIAQRFKQELNAEADFRGLSVTEIVKQEQVLGVAVTADGTMDVHLDEALDFWKRNALHVRVVELTKDIVAKTAAANRALAVKFHAPTALVRDPEAFRSELVKRWVARTQEFINAAQSPGAPLAVVDCDVPSAVQQNPVSVDEVQLSLQIRCRIDTPNRLTSPRTGVPHDGNGEFY